MPDIRIALIGTGMIAPAHIKGAAATPGVRLGAIVDPGAAARALAQSAGLRWYADHRALLERDRTDAAIVATPNVLHVPVALDCIAAGLPVLVEKPIAAGPARPAPGDPYQEQLRHFAAVVRGSEAPVTSGVNGTRTLAATHAVHMAARTRRPVVLLPA